MAINAADISAPMIEKYSMPRSNGVNDVTVAAHANPKIPDLIPFESQNRNTVHIIVITHVRIAVMSGPKLAYPNGRRSKYEKVSLHGSPSGFAQSITTPYGKISRIIAAMLNTTREIFFIFINTPRFL